MQFQPSFDCWPRPMTQFNCVPLELCGKYACCTTQRRQPRWSPMRFRPSLDSSPQINGLSDGLLFVLCGPSALFGNLFSDVALNWCRGFCRKVDLDRNPCLLNSPQVTFISSNPI